MPPFDTSTSDAPICDTRISNPQTFWSRAVSRRLPGIAVFVLTSLLLVVGAWPRAALAQQTFLVNNRGDVGDANPGDGTCSTAAGVCTLRAAIEEANADPDADTIEFSNIPTTGSFAVISPSSELSITEQLTLDGTTAPGWSESGPPIVVLDGSGVSARFDNGLRISGPGAAGTTVSGLAILNFPSDGIDVLADANNTVIFYCYVGIDVDGMTAAGNGDNGIFVGADDVVIGSSGFVGGRNVISGNDRNGVSVFGNDVTIGDNYIGTTSSGDAAVPNILAGVVVTLNTTGHQIGNYFEFFGSEVETGNVISGNGGSGIFLLSDGNNVQANRIGTNASGDAAIPNQYGIDVRGNDNVIGPQTDGPGRNIISGNEEDGIIMGSEGGSASDNNTIRFNYIGVNAAADAAVGNASLALDAAGVRIEVGSDNLITNNVISGNAGRGVDITDNNSSRNFVQSNYIGTNRTFADLGNGIDGVRVNVMSAGTAAGNEVGGRFEGDGNVIGFNGDDGVQIEGAYNAVYRNFIGTNANGDDLGNADDGVLINGADNVLVGLEFGAGNVIGLNGGNGITVIGSNNFIAGNYIGTNANEDDLGNGESGIRIGRDGNFVGYGFANDLIPDDPLQESASGNAIAYNTGAGIEISGSTTPVGTSIRANSVFQNGGIGIDLGGDGVTANDFGDSDSGVNNLQNTPEIDQTQTQYNTSSGQVEVRYRVNCNTTDCNYGSNGMKIDIYLADGQSSGEGRTYLHTDEYPSSTATRFRNISFAPPSGVTVSRSDFIVATATDADNNTSEFSPPPAPQLPVELAGLSAQPTGKTVVLTWKTLTEQGNDRFEIEQKAPGASGFRSVGTVEGAGTTSETTDYRFATGDLPAGTHTFRLRQVDVDGTESLSRTVTARVQLAEAMALSAPSPNPVRNQLSVRVGVQETQTVRVVLYDLLGRAVATLHEGALPGGEERTLRATLPTLPSGKYFLRLEGETGQMVQPVTVIR